MKSGGADQSAPSIADFPAGERLSSRAR
jgi:hypothetical protein